MLILSANTVHVSQTIACLEAGKDVLVEKPVAMGEQELKKLVAAHEKHPERIVMVGYCRRFLGNYLRMKELLQKDERPITYARIRTNITEDWYYVGQTRTPYFGFDVPPTDWSGLPALYREQLKASTAAS